MNSVRGGASAVRTIVLAAIVAACGSFVLLLVPPQYAILALGSGAVVLASFLMMQAAIGILNFRALTIPAVFYWVYLALIFFPAFYVFSDQAGPYRSRYLLAVESVLITVPVGIILINMALKFRRDEITSYYESPVLAKELKSSPLPAYLVFVLIALVFSAIRIQEVRTIPLIYLFQHPGDFFTLQLLREDAGKLLVSRLDYVYFLLKTVIYPFLILTAFGRMLITRRVKWRLIFLSIFVVGVLYAGMAIEKGVVAAIIAELSIYFYLFKRGRPGLRVAVLAPLLFLAFPLLVLAKQYVGTDQGTPFAMIQAIGERIFYVPANVLYYYYEVFPAIVPYQHGASIGKLAELFGWKMLSIPNIVGIYITGQGPGILKSMTANAAFIGNFNADFGLYGVIAGGLLAGGIMQFAQIQIVRRPKTVGNLAVFAFYLWTFSSLIDNPLPVVLLSDGVLVVPVMLWMMNRLESVLNASVPGRGTRLAQLHVRGKASRIVRGPLGAQRALPRGHT